MLEDGESEEGEGASAELGSDASFESTMYEDEDGCVHVLNWCMRLCVSVI